MVPRYARPVMTAIWSPETRYRIWFEIEAYAAEAMAELGTIPADAARTITAALTNGALEPVDVARIDAIEAETRHDVIAFLTWLAEGIGENSRFVHQGLTSSDVLDTCFSVQLTQAADLLRNLLSLFPGNAILQRDLAMAESGIRPAPLPVAGVGRARWDVALVRQRNGEPFQTIVEACDETGRIALPARLVDRPAAAGRAGARAVA